MLLTRGRQSPLGPDRWGTPDVRIPFSPSMAFRAAAGQYEYFYSNGWNRNRYLRSYHSIWRNPATQTYSDF